MKKLLLFGAGKIGRSFISPLFGQAGYEIVFADIDRKLVDLLSKTSSYKVIIRDSNHPEKEKICTIENISAVHLSDKNAIKKHIIESDLIATSVGKRGLLSLPELMAEGFRERYQLRKEDAVDIILAENIRGAAALFREEIKSFLPGVPVDDYIGLVETSIGKMVPNMTEKQQLADPLTVVAEPYNHLIVDKQGFRNNIPDVEGLDPKMNMKAWVDRKIFIHNMGHAALAYQANYFDPDIVYTWEALEIKQLKELTRNTMLQSAKILVDKYPDIFILNQLNKHIDDLLERFSNRALGDTIFRVGCDLSRKLNSDDRLMIPVIAGIKSGKEYSLILEAWVKGCFFNAADEHGEIHPEDREFKNKYLDNPLDILNTHCNFKQEIHAEIEASVREILEKLNK